jgi:tetratricopeptide (TPR) repeat protein
VARSATASRLKPFLGNLAALSVSPTVEEHHPLAQPEWTQPVDRARRESDDRRASLTAVTALAQARDLVARYDWAHAQRLLEEASSRGLDDELRAYLTEIRAIRRVLRQLRRRPRDAQLHLELGRLYFGLELGDAALSEFNRAIALEPTLAEAHFGLALEYLFRDEEDPCRASLARAALYRSTIPSYESLSSLLFQAGEE